MKSIKITIIFLTFCCLAVLVFAHSILIAAGYETGLMSLGFKTRLLILIPFFLMIFVKIQRGT